MKFRFNKIPQFSADALFLHRARSKKVNEMALFFISDHRTDLLMLRIDIIMDAFSVLQLFYCLLIQFLPPRLINCKVINIGFYQQRYGSGIFNLCMTDHFRHSSFQVPGLFSRLRAAALQIKRIRPIKNKLKYSILLPSIGTIQCLQQIGYPKARLC